MTLKELLVGAGTQLRSIWMIGLHAFAKRETQMYPEEPVYLPPRFRGRIVLTRDPDGEERCVACNLCAVACPVGCISLQKQRLKMVAGIRSFSASTSHAAFSAVCAKKPVRQRLFSLLQISNWVSISAGIWFTRRGSADLRSG